MSLFGCRHFWKEQERHNWKMIEVVRDGWTGKVSKTGPFESNTVVVVLRCQKCGELKNHMIEPKT